MEYIATSLAEFTKDTQFPLNIGEGGVFLNKVFICVKESKKNNGYFTAIKESKAPGLVKWVEFDREKLEGKVLALPTREDVDSQIAEHMIVELYSK